MPRFYCTVALHAGITLVLPAGAARHVQVLRMQPGDAITLFDGAGGEYAAVVESMGRSEVAVRVGAHDAVEREAAHGVHLAVGMPANERMDWLVEKATELGAASVQPLMSAHGVLRLAGERAEKKRAHWEAIAVAACEQCGRNRVPVIHPVRGFAEWMGLPESVGSVGSVGSAGSAGSAGTGTAGSGARRLVLSFAAGTRRIADLAAERDADPAIAIAGADADADMEAPRTWHVLSGPEGGLSAAEEERALSAGFIPVTLGARVLRAETAALAALMALTGPAFA